MRGLWRSSVGKKIVSGFTGLCLVLFVIIHLIGNLLILVGAEAFNGYANLLMTLCHGAFVYVAEAGLLLFFVMHVVSGISVSLRKGQARDVGYEVRGDAGGPSQKGIASRSMIISGIALLIFLVCHLIHFKFGPGESRGYVALVHGEPVRDLYRLVIEEFNKLIPTLAYSTFMLFLGLHLWHGFASAFQSLGAGSPALTRVVRVAGAFVSLILAIGFLFLPIYIFVAVEPPVAAVLPLEQVQ